ncbi:hypothetical protein V8G54_035555 [Vigna mungo]|uniref:C2H2-type domain-containing protein n=1 Tax=Vigna mungo TaxID=3915 RepID=A0AAQ3RDC0_VIGMU
MKSQSQNEKAAIIGDDRRNNWEERAFAEDAVGSMWPPRPYCCNFCKREFRSAQALGGHMNIHRRDKARLKQNHHTIKSLLGNNNHHPFSSTQINCGLTHAHNYSSQATTISTTRSLSQENKFSPSSSSSFILGQMGSPNSEQAMECVETSLSIGMTTMFGQNSSPIVPCGDRPNISCKRLKNNISSLPLFLRPPCSNVELHHAMEDLDLELRLGKQQVE